MKLDWNKTKVIKWGNRTYLDIPFVSKDGSDFIPRSSEVGKSSFHLVIHQYKNGEYRGSIRTATQNVSINDVGEYQEYSSLDGRQLNTWYHSHNTQKITTVTSIQLSDDQFRKLT